MNKILI